MVSHGGIHGYSVDPVRCSAGVRVISDLGPGEEGPGNDCDDLSVPRDSDPYRFGLAV